MLHAPRKKARRRLSDICAIATAVVCAGTGPLQAAAAPDGLAGTPKATPGVLPSSPASPAALEVRATSGVLPAGPGAARHDFGTLSPLDRPGAVVEQVFTLQNTTPKPVTISRVVASCGCLRADLLALPEAGPSAPRFPRTLAPGDQAAVRVRMHLDQVLPGPAAKVALVYTAESPAAPAARLEIRGTVRPTIAFGVERTGNDGRRAAEQQNQPSQGTRTIPTIQSLQTVLDLGQLRPSAGAKNAPGTGSSGLILAVTPDPRLLAAAGSKIPALSLSNPALKVTPVPAATKANATALPGSLASSPGVLRYRLSLAPDAPLGPLLGTLTFADAAAPPMASPASPAQSLSAPPGNTWRTAALVVTGEVVGDASAVPGMVAFGLTTPPAGAPRAAETATARVGGAVRQIRVIARGPDVLKGAVVTADHPNVHAQFAPPATAADGTPAGENTGSRPTAQGEERRLLVTLRDPAALPVGPFLAHVTVSLRNGQRLVLPVTAYRLATPPAAANAL
ncbi:MAG: DUF1573 domain-containing protein [Armatimonadota bacterium]